MTKKAPSKAVSSNNQRSNAKNPNYGTTGTNPTNAHVHVHVHGNRGKQLNPNNKNK